MVEAVRQKADVEKRDNIRPKVRDFVADGTGLESASQAHAMIFNLLHLENPVALLREAHRVLGPSGMLSVIHWRSDIATPRGPSLGIRPARPALNQFSPNINKKGDKPVNQAALLRAALLALAVLSAPDMADNREKAVKAMEEYLDFVDYGGATMFPEQIPREDWKRFHVIDARDKDQFAKEHIPGAVNLE